MTHRLDTSKDQKTQELGNLRSKSNCELVNEYVVCSKFISPFCKIILQVSNNKITANCKLVIKIKKITSETNYGSQSEFQNGYTSRQGFQRVCSKQHHTDSQAMMNVLKGKFVSFFSPPHLRTSVLATHIINMWGNLVQFSSLHCHIYHKTDLRNMNCQLTMLSDKKVDTFRQGRKKGLNHYLECVFIQNEIRIWQNVTI